MAIKPFMKRSDIAKSLKFYTEGLAFEVIRAPEIDPDSFMS